MEIRLINNRTALLKGKKESLLLNPSPEIVKQNKTNSRVILITEKDFDSFGLDNEKVIIRGAGEYEVGGLEVVGLSGGEGQTIYVANIDGVNVGIVGNLTVPLTDKKIERVDEVDVLIVSLGNMANKTILQWAKKWGANYLVPMNFNDKEGAIKSFLDEADREDLEPVDSLKVDKDTLPEGMEIVVLKTED
jgi:hypothetical protein